jgi:spore maturation protein CgeB
VASRVPKTELLYEDYKHLRYFDSNEECVELIKYYLKNEQERKEIAAGGMAHAHENFNCQRIAKDMVDFLATGTYDAPWKDVYNV